MWRNFAFRRRLHHVNLENILLFNFVSKFKEISRSLLNSCRQILTIDSLSALTCNYFILSYINELAIREIQNATHPLDTKFGAGKKIIANQNGTGFRATILTTLPTGHIRTLVNELGLACS